MMALMVGGPLHGQTMTVPHPPHTVILIPRAQDPFSFSPEPESELPPEPHQYQLRYYDAAWHPSQRKPAYLCMDQPERIDLAAQVNDEVIQNARTAEALWRGAVEAALPSCAVPQCTEKGRLTFTAAENGTLAGRAWTRGEKITLCHPHGHDVYRAQHTQGMAQLAEWLRPDAMWDWIDAYDSGDLIYGAEILERTARMLRLTQSMEAH